MPTYEKIKREWRVGRTNDDQTWVTINEDGKLSDGDYFDFPKAYEWLDKLRVRNEKRISEIARPTIDHKITDEEREQIVAINNETAAIRKLGDDLSRLEQMVKEVPAQYLPAVFNCFLTLDMDF